MSVTIRLTRIGKKNSPAYRIVAVPTRSKRDGYQLEIIGHYNPSTNPVSFKYDEEKYNDWIKKGAKPSEAVSKLIDGKYTYIKYAPNKAKDEAKTE